MLEHIQGIPNRIADLKRKLAAREGKKEYKENCEALRTEITRLENVTASAEALEQFVTEEESTKPKKRRAKKSKSASPVASDPVEDL